MDPTPDSIPDIAFPPALKETYTAVFLESILYGAYLPVFLECMIVLRRRKLGNANHWYLVATTILMFALVSTRCIYEVHGSIKSFDNLADLLEIQSSAFFISMDYAFLTAIADAFLVFRTFIIWNKRLEVIVFPAALYLGSCGASIYSLIEVKRVGPEGDITGHNVVNAGDIFLILTLCTNVVCTGMISFRILHSYGKRGSSSRYLEGVKIVSVLIESAAINTLLLVGLLVTTRLNSLASFVLSCCSSPTIGLVFSLIVVRVGRGTSYGDSTSGNIEESGVGEFSTRRPSFEFDESRGAIRSVNRSEVRVRLEHRNRDGLEDLQSTKDGRESVI